MPLKLANNAASQLAAQILIGDGTIQVTGADSEEFPVIAAGSGDWFPVTVVDNLGNRENMRCTIRTAGSAVLTVSRAQEGTSAKAFPNPANTKVELRLTAGAFLDGTADASRLTTGTVADARLTPRLRGGPIACTNLDALTVTGQYYADNVATGRPENTGGFVTHSMFDAPGTLAYQIWVNVTGTVRYERWKNGSWGAWQKFDPYLSAVPTGTIFDYAAPSVPAGWLACGGQAVSRTTYSGLFGVISNRFGGGDGSTTFNVPDLRGRVTAGYDALGGTDANRLTNPRPGGVNGSAFAAGGGEETHTLTASELAAHTHADTFAIAANGSHQHRVGDSILAGSAGGTGLRVNTGTGTAAMSDTVAAHTHTLSGSVTSTPAGVAHNNVQPTLIVYKIIKY